MPPIIVTKPSEEAARELGVFDWPTWSCDVSTFDWHYDQKETCYVLEGRVKVSAAGQEVEFGPGDLVVFAKGLDCVWNVISPVKKHYRFG